MYIHVLLELQKSVEITVNFLLGSSYVLCTMYYANFHLATFV